MRSDFAYDPVTAIDESAAARDTALVFTEIRRTMDIPLVTSIWRRLAGMDDSLRPAWEAARPIYESGEPERALAPSIAAVNLPSPEPLVPTALFCRGAMLQNPQHVQRICSFPVIDAGIGKQNHAVRADHVRR